MAAPSRKIVDAQTPVHRKKSALRLANPQDYAAPSPALRRQEMLQDQWLEHRGRAAPSKKWPIRRTVALVGLSCGGFWIGVAWGLTRLAP